MTLVNISVRVPTSTGTAPATGKMFWNPTRARTVGDDLVLPKPFSVELVDGVSAVDVAPTTADWSWKVTTDFKGVHPERYFVTVPESGPVAFTALPKIDPDTLEPVEVPTAAWWAVADSTVTDAQVVGDDLILTRYNGEQTNAGNVRGLPGAEPSNAVTAQHLTEDGPSRTALNATIVEAKSTAYLLSGDRPDGALQTSSSDSGHPFVLSTANAGTPLFSVENGYLTAASGLPYMNFDALPGPVTEIRVVVRWNDDAKATSNPAVIIVSDQMFRPVTEGPIANAGAHVLIYPDRMNMQKRIGDDGTASGVATSVKQVYYGKTLAFGVDHEFVLQWDGVQAWLQIPDGRRFAAPVDAEVSAWWGPYASYEVVQNLTGNKVMIKNPRHTSEVKQITPSQQGKWLYHYETTGDGTITVPVGSSNTLLFSSPATFVVPDGRKSVVFKGAVAINSKVPVIPSTALLILRAGVANATYTKNLTVRRGNTPANGTNTEYWDLGRHILFEVVVDLSAFTPGSLQTVVLYASATPNMFEFIDSGGLGTTVGGQRSWVDVYEFS